MGKTTGAEAPAVKRLMRAGSIGAVACAAILLTAAPAAASLNGPCEARGRFTPAEGASGPDAPFTVDAATATGVIEVPDEASVEWFGQIGDGQDTEPRTNSGYVAVVLPPILDDLLGGVAELYTWGDDDATSTQEQGVETYEISPLVPSGTEIVVTGRHTDALGTCSGTVVLKLAGSPLTEPVTIASLAITVGSGALLVLTGRP